MKNLKTNWFLSIGLVLISIMLVSKHLIQLPEAFQCFGLGLGIGLELLGIFYINNDMTKLKNFKKKFLKI
jgi:hypothetical protein